MTDWLGFYIDYKANYYYSLLAIYPDDNNDNIKAVAEEDNNGVGERWSLFIVQCTLGGLFFFGDSFTVS